MTAERHNPDGNEARATLAHKVGASRLYVLTCNADDVFEQLKECVAPASLEVRTPLEGTPVSCTDLRAEGRAARERGELLVVDNTLPGPFNCDALRLGAHALVVALDDALSMAAITRDANELTARLGSALYALPQADKEGYCRARDLLDAQQAHWRTVSDAAQVVASYLRCHPAVCEVRYPGLQDDPSYEVAARTLQRGFSPIVDYRVDDTWHRYEATTQDARSQILDLEHVLT